MDEALDRAMDVFWRRGYSAAPIQEICDAMDLKPGSVYAAFGSKHGLFLAVVQRYLDKMNRPGLDLMTSSSGGLDGIRAYLDFIADGILNGKRIWGCLGTNALMELRETDEEIAGLMTEHLARLKEAFLDALQRDGIESADARAQYLLCISQGLNVLAKTSPGHDELKAIIDSAMASFVPQSISAE